MTNILKPGDINEDGHEIEQDGGVTWQHKRICRNCGSEFDEAKGEGYNVGRVQVWMCPECCKIGSRQADVRAYMRAEMCRRNKGKGNV